MKIIKNSVKSDFAHRWYTPLNFIWFEVFHLYNVVIRIFETLIRVVSRFSHTFVSGGFIMTEKIFMYPWMSSLTNPEWECKNTWSNRHIWLTGSRGFSESSRALMTFELWVSLSRFNKSTILLWESSKSWISLDPGFMWFAKALSVFVPDVLP